MKKNQSVFKLLLTGAFFLVLFGCKKGIIENQADPLSKEKQGGALTTLNVPPDVYVTGSLNNQAVYWKNGTVVTLPGGELATGIVVVGTNVHVCGYGVSPSTGELVAKYWLNGVATDLSDGLSECRATGIGISGSDVIIAGYEGRYVRTACYWRNAARTNLSGGSLPGQVFVATNGSFYIADRNSNNYWKDGVLQSPLQIPVGSANLEAVKEYGGIVYAVGERVTANGTATPLFWINGVYQAGFLGNPNGYADAQDFVISPTGQRHFAGLAGTGWDSARIMYWDPVGAADYWGTYTASSLASIALNGTDVYVCGSEFNYPVMESRAVVWQNSGFNPTYLTDGTTPAITTDIEVY